MTEATLSDWPRRHYRPGGADAYLFYVVYGPLQGSSAISRSRYRCEGIPAGVEVSSYHPEMNPQVVDSFREGYLWDLFREAHPEVAQETARAAECLMIRGELKDPQTLNYLRDVVGLIQWRLDQGAISVYDPQMFHWWIPAEWRERAFEPGGPVPRHHAVILYSEEPEGTEWFHTRGLRKFGRPDLSIHHVTSRYRNAVIELCNRFIEYQAFGGIIDDGEEVRMAALPSGMTCWNRGDIEDPDFNNRHVEILWPSAP
jgi:hypothetical protein